ncbi:MAG TPA: DUF3800 domain-containing protein [Anaerolineae bacterium]|nr:DUF3800 domain-containing protein [Anaerolineae bacterium]
MLTLTFAGDESGDVSFAFDKGASRYFVVAVIATEHPDNLRQSLEEFRKESHLPLDFEFSFHELTSNVLRRRVFNRLVELNFESWAIITDKTMLSDPFKVMHPLDFYLYLVTELIQIIPLNKRDGATLIMDEFVSRTQLQSELRRILHARNIPRGFKRVMTRRSKNEPLIQIADLMAGAILRRDAKGEADAYEQVEHKIERVLEFLG